MREILVSIDFSENSKNAFFYALELAAVINSTIRVVNVVHPKAKAGYTYPVKSFEEEVDERKKQLNEFVNQSIHTGFSNTLTLTNIKQEVLQGFAVEEIVKLSESEKVDLIVMGRTGAGGALNKLFGSVSSNVAEKSKCPVLLVPQNIEFKEFGEMMYASDFENSSNKALEKIAELAAAFTAKVHLVHVQPEQTNTDFQLEELIFEQIVREKAPWVETKYVTVWDVDIWHGLHVYAVDHNIDVMVLVKPKRNFWDNFWHKSVSNEIINKSVLPILILPV